MPSSQEDPSHTHIKTQGSNCCQPRRKQYQSCDHCRKRRRACDAITLGIDPFKTGDASDEDETKVKACSTCQKSGIHCTFNWLRVCRRESLPQGIKKKLNATHPIPSQPPSNDDSAQRQDSLADSLWSTVQSHNHPITFELTPTYSYEREADQNQSTLNQSETYPPWNIPLDPLDDIDLDPTLICLDRHVQGLTTDDAIQQMELGASSMPTNIPPPAKISTLNRQTPIALSNLTGSRDDVFLDHLEPLSGFNIPIPPTTSSRRPSYAYYSNEESEAVYDNSELTAFATQGWLQYKPSASSGDRSNLHERHPSHTSSRSLVIEELRHVYKESVENSLRRHASGDTCVDKRKRSIQDDLDLDDPCATLLSAGVLKTVVAVTKHTECSTKW